MGFLKFKKEKVVPKKHDDVRAKPSSDKEDVRAKPSSDKAPVIEINIKKNDGNKRIKKVPSAALNYPKSPVPVFIDYAGSDKGRQLDHKTYLFELSQRLVDETPPERRQSLVTAITGVLTDESRRPPSLANDYDCNLAMTPLTLKVMTQDDMDKKESDTPTELGVLDFVLSCNACSDNICAALQNNEIEVSQLPVLESGPVAIPREISFSPLICRDQSLLTEVGQSKSFLLKHSKPSLLKRISGNVKGEGTDNSIMSRLKVFVDAPVRAFTTDAASVDDSLLTTPSMKADSLDEALTLEKELPLMTMLRKIGRRGVSPSLQNDPYNL
jgi:hypothetical protein